MERPLCDLDNEQAEYRIEQLDVNYCAACALDQGVLTDPGFAVLLWNGSHADWNRVTTRVVSR
jgi:hypothetical protein